MKDPYGLEASGLPPELIQQLAGLKNREQIARAMMAQSMQAPQVEQPKGRFQGRISPLEFIGKAAQGISARDNMRGVEEGMGQVAGEKQRLVADAMAQYQRQKMGSPEIPYNDTLGSEAPQGPVVPGMAADPKGAIAFGLGNPLVDRGVVDFDMKALERGEAREDQQAFQSAQHKQAAADRAANLAAQLEQRKMEVEARLADKALDRESRAMLMQSQQAIQRELGLARTEANKIAVQARVDAKAAAAQAKGEKGIEARSMVSTLLGEIHGKFGLLQERGAAVDTTKSGAKNLMASARASMPGQFLGKVFGTEEQALRDQIKQSEPMLMNAIRVATAQGARGLDSNKELEFYKQALADPTKSIQYNLAALEVLEAAYGISGSVKGGSDEAIRAAKAKFANIAKPQGTAAPAAVPGAAAPGVPPDVDPKVWSIMTPEEQALWR